MIRQLCEPNQSDGEGTNPKDHGRSGIGVQLRFSCHESEFECVGLLGEMEGEVIALEMGSVGQNGCLRSEFNGLLSGVGRLELN